MTFFNYSDFYKKRLTGVYVSPVRKYYNGGYVEESFSENLGARKKIKIFLSPTSLKT